MTTLGVHPNLQMKDKRLPGPPPRRAVPAH